MTGFATRAARIAALEAAVTDRILVLDGAMGTMIQAWKPEAADWRGGGLAGHAHDLAGDNDVLNLSRPDMIEAIHRAYLEAGADIVATNTFNATAISQADYGAAHFAYDINRAGAEIARRAADAMTAADPARPRFVAGAIGPTSKTCSISPDVEDPGFRGVTFEDIRAAAAEAARGLVDGGADLLLVETIFDTLNAKAVVYALEELFEEIGARLPVILSGTITDLSGRTLTGQTVEAFWIALSHARPFAIGLNCSLGAQELRPYVAELSRVAGTRLCAYPNAGLPNEFGAYDEVPAETARHLGEWARAGLVNIVGGCCGTTPEHITAIAAVVAGVNPRAVPAPPPRLRLSGLEAFEVRA